MIRSVDLCLTLRTIRSPFATPFCLSKVENWSERWSMFCRISVCFYQRRLSYEETVQRVL